MNVFPVWSFIVSLQENIGLRKLNRQSTLALISVEENAKRIDRRNSIYNKVRESPPPYDEVFNSRRSSVMSRISEQSASSSQSRSGKAITIVMPKKSNRVTPMDSREDIKLKCQSFWRRRPILKLFLVILFNGIASMAFAAVFIEVFILMIFKKLFTNCNASKRYGLWKGLIFNPQCFVSAWETSSRWKKWDESKLIQSYSRSGI